MPTVLPPPDEAAVLTWTSDEILKGSNDVVIVHNGERYHLKMTQNDKLMLVK